MDIRLKRGSRYRIRRILQFKIWTQPVGQINKAGIPWQSRQKVTNESFVTLPVTLFRHLHPRFAKEPGLAHEL